MTSAGILEKLKSDLSVQLAARSDAERAVRQLEVAISAIEANEVSASQRPGFRRGYLLRGVLDAIRDGVWSASAIARHLEQQGIKTTPQCVSNAIGRLQAKGKVEFDPEMRAWRLTAITEAGREAIG
jgi:hypothetical protein